MKIYYAKNSNGKYLSADGQTRYEKFCGRAAYTYLKSNEGKDKRFAKISDADDLDEVFLEIDTDSIPTFRVDERREQYVRDTKRESGICVIPFMLARVRVMTMIKSPERNSLPMKA